MEANTGDKSSKENPGKIFNIKSKVIIKNIFSFILEKKKLYLIKVNNQIKNKLEIDIESYKKICVKERISEKNGYGVEYDTNTFSLVFEGEYLNWKKNGNGKEFDDNGKLIFEGVYLNGKRNGKGKVYHIFKGYKSHDFSDNFYEMEYLNGKMWNGKICDDKGNIIFEIKNGKGIFIETEKCEEYTIFTEYYI